MLDPTPFSGNILKYTRYENEYVVYLKPDPYDSDTSVCRLMGGKKESLNNNDLEQCPRSPRENPINRTAYTRILQECLLAKRPHSYLEWDVFRCDAETLGIHPQWRVEWEIEDGAPFGYIIRDMGTQLLTKEHGSNPQYLTSTQQAYRNENHLYYWWDGDTLQRVPSIVLICENLALANGIENWS